MRRSERWALAALWLVLVLVLAVFLHQTAPMKHLDSVFLFESVSAILEHGRPTSSVVAAWEDTVRFFEMAPEKVCEAQLHVTGRPPYNVLHNHAYFALYPIALLASIVGAEPALALLHAAAHLAVVLLPYVFLRRQGLAALPSAVFSFLVLAYPGWSLSAMGDYYLDRLYLPFALLLVYLLHERAEADPQGSARGWTTLVLIVSLVAASFTERAAIMIIGALVFFLAMSPRIRSTRATRWSLIAVAGLLALCVLAYLVFLHRGIEGGGDLVKSAVGPSVFLLKLEDPRFLAFVLTNVLFLGAWALFSGRRNIALLAGAMLPNVLMDIGGAELTGWSTHYHVTYMPFLIFAASLGYLHVVKHVRPSATWALYPLAMAYAVGLNMYYDPYTARFSLKREGTPASFGISGSVYRYYATPAASGEHAVSLWARTVESVVPPGSKVGVTEGMMPVLYRSRQLSMYPVGIDSADYLVIPGTSQQGRITSTSGAVSYLGPAAAERLNDCLLQRAVRQGFVLIKDVPAIGLLILKRSAPSQEPDRVAR